ncbi:MAG: MFS transporter, partial [Novosphingobium sp.]|nr:MFS transporter [Novosphingobium sp.]
FGLGGEWGGAALLAVENAPPGWHTRFGAAPQLGAPLGYAAANGLFLIMALTMSGGDFVAWGWRIPFLASAVLVALGLWVRLRIGETPQFRAALERAAPPPVPLARLLGSMPGAVLAGSAGVIATFAAFYLTTAFALAQATGKLGYAKDTFLGVQLFANLFFLGGIVTAAVWSDRTSPGRLLAIGALGTAVMGLPFSLGLASGSLAILTVTLCLTMYVMGLTSGPLGGWLATLFPVQVRYSGISLSFTAGGIIGGALSPIAAEMMSTAGWGRWIGLLLTAAGVLTLLGVKFARAAQPEAQP